MVPLAIKILIGPWRYVTIACRSYAFAALHANACPVAHRRGAGSAIYPRTHGETRYAAPAAEVFEAAHEQGKWHAWQRRFPAQPP